MGGGGTDRRWMGIVEWGQSGVGRWDIRKWNDWEEWSGVRCKIDVGFGRRGYNRMFGFEVVWTIMLHKEFQACAIHPPYKYSSSRHICLHRIRHSSLLQRSIVPF